MKRWFHVIESDKDGNKKAWGFCVDENLKICDIADDYRHLKNKSTQDLKVRAEFYNKEVIEIKVSV